MIWFYFAAALFFNCEHNFQGFYNYPNRHSLLIRLLEIEFGDIAYARPVNDTMNSGDLTINKMRQEGKHLIILYNDVKAARSKFKIVLFRKDFKL